MKLVASLAMRLVPALAGAGVSAASIHTLFGMVTAVLTALYTVFITVEAGLRLWERWKLKHASPRTRGADE